MIELINCTSICFLYTSSIDSALKFVLCICYIQTTMGENIKFLKSLLSIPYTKLVANYCKEVDTYAFTPYSFYKT